MDVGAVRRSSPDAFFNHEILGCPWDEIGIDCRVALREGHKW